MNRLSDGNAPVSSSLLFSASFPRPSFLPDPADESEDPRSQVISVQRAEHSFGGLERTRGDGNFRVANRGIIPALAPIPSAEPRTALNEAAT